MVATVLIRVPLMLLPLVQSPAPVTDCQLEVLTPIALEERALVQFNTVVDHYVKLHRRLERSLPPEEMFEDPEDMFAASDALASAMRDARPNAKQGNVFGPGVAQVFRDRLDAAIRQHGHTPADILAAINEERLPGMPDPEVNQAFPWGLGAAMWPTLLRALPAVPRELEYRFWDRNLVLIDVHASMVVDILNEALPAK